MHVMVLRRQFPYNTTYCVISYVAPSNLVDEGVVVFPGSAVPEVLPTPLGAGQQRGVQTREASRGRRGRHEEGPRGKS